MPDQDQCIKNYICYIKNTTSKLPQCTVFSEYLKYSCMQAFQTDNAHKSLLCFPNQWKRWSLHNTIFRSVGMEIFISLLSFVSCKTAKLSSQEGDPAKIAKVCGTKSGLILPGCRFEHLRNESYYVDINNCQSLSTQATLYIWQPLLWD